MLTYWKCQHYEVDRCHLPKHTTFHGIGNVSTLRHVCGESGARSSVLAGASHPKPYTGIIRLRRHTTGSRQSRDNPTYVEIQEIHEQYMAAQSRCGSPMRSRVAGRGRSSQAKPPMPLPKWPPLVAACDAASCKPPPLATNVPHAAVTTSRGPPPFGDGWGSSDG
jgi:hypothetical protein